MGRKARNAGTTGHRMRTCYKAAEKSIYDTSGVRVSGGGSRSANRKAKKGIVRERIERITEMMRQNAIADVENELDGLHNNTENLTQAIELQVIDPQAIELLAIEPQTEETVITVTS